MELSMQASLLNVRDLDRSIEFYRDVFDFGEAARSDQAAALMINDSDRRQVLVLRAPLGLRSPHAGRGGIGPRLLAFEAGSPAELRLIEERLVARGALLGRGRTPTWEVIVGEDPDHIAFSISSSLTGMPIRREDWDHLDEMVYSVAE
jgi:catechol 2,3-dioxygenase-like lactoylglutathione lyase family enzyme